jgi:ubiquinone/menaquinone biosynthesis C-methylase UbiE
VERLQIARVKRSREEARASYDRLSGMYDVLEGRWERKPMEIGLEKLAAEAGETVLEVGFGTGHAIIALARAVGSSGKVLGVDLSPRMLDIAWRRVGKEALSSRVTLMNADAVRGIPLPDQSVDAVFMSFVLELFDTPEIPIVLGECSRLLRADGRICVVSLSKRGGATVMRNAYERGHELFPRLLDCRPIFVREALEETGFRVPEVTSSTLFGLPVDIVLGEIPAHNHSSRQPGRAHRVR